MAEDGRTDLVVCHARTCIAIVGHPLRDPDRHTFVQPIHRDAGGMPVFGRPSGIDGRGDD
ncbi:MAG TPA: hypothetical protein VNK41_11165 [Vicinamibacterales bacterium]|nr:hypothetical protein [Vicinamibacterales bacterium]